MKGLSTLIALQALSSTISGVLMSQMSFVGKMGISILYREYGLFKVWWKTALLLFAVQLALLLVLLLIKWLLGRRLSPAAILLVMAFGLVGAYFTYLDFTTTSHRILKVNFHAGGYLFWGTWGLTCLYFLLVPLRKKKSVTPPLDSSESPPNTFPTP